MKRPRLVRIAVLVGVMLAALAWPSVAPAQVTLRNANFTYLYDLDSTTLTYCRLVGQNFNPYGTAFVGPARIKTTGSSTTVAELTASTNPFTNVAVGDVLVIARLAPATAPYLRVVRARASAASITVDTAIDLSATGGYAFSYLTLQCGTGDEDGWIDTSGLSTKTITFQLEQISGVTGGIDTRFECRGDAIGSLPNIVHPGASATAVCTPGTLAAQFCNFTTAGVATGRFGLAIPQDVSGCREVRIGMKINTSDGAEAAEGDNERITVTLDGSFIQ